jgi:hypothetical protein
MMRTPGPAAGAALIATNRPLRIVTDVAMVDPAVDQRESFIAVERRAVLCR